MTEGRCAFYARVSSESQARDNTIASQVMALRERIAADGLQLEPDQCYVDEGYSGSILARPALERLRDAVAGGHIERIYVHAPDRLARRYAHQVLVIDEFRRAGAEVIFLNRPIGGTAEDDLLLQVQGVIAEYERAKILERSRRGRRHAAHLGSVSALTGAPFGYRYVSRALGGGVARFEVVEDEAHIVRLIFAWIGLDRMSLRQICRRLHQMGCRTRRGSTYWHASTIRGMLDNPTYMGRAAFGRARFLPPRPRLRPIRGHPKSSPRATSRVAVPREEWIEIPVPALVDPTVFEAARSQLEENRSRKRDRKPGQRWLLQGLTVCQQCGYSYYGKTAPRSRKYDPANVLRYYRCTGADGYRFNGKAVCRNGPVRGDQLEQVVWDQVRSLLEEPGRVADEYRRRIGQAGDGTAMPAEIVRLGHQMTMMRRGIGRLIDSFAEGVIDKAEFAPRIAGLKQRLSQLQERHQAAVEVIEVERDLSLVISRLEDFSAKVTKGLDDLDRAAMQDIVRTLVRRIEIGDSHIEVIFRVPSFDSPPGASPTNTGGSWQHCTGVHHPAFGQHHEPFGGVGSLDDLNVDLREDAGERLTKLGPLISAVGIELQQERKQPEQRRARLPAASALAYRPGCVASCP
jgi:site-specific DNA recombinase